MPKLKPQARFFLRGSVSILATLTFWWVLLLGPMSEGLKGAAGVLLRVQDTGTGDWTIRVPLERTLPATTEQAGQQIHWIEFDIRRGDLIAFTFSLPLFWAIMLAAPDLRRNLRVLAWGTAGIAAMELAMFFIFAHISARNAVSQMGGADDEISKWARHVGEYLIISVLPFMTPFILAFALHTGLMRELFPSGTKDAAAPAVLAPRKKRRGKKEA